MGEKSGTPAEASAVQPKDSQFKFYLFHSPSLWTYAYFLSA